MWIRGLPTKGDLDTNSVVSGFTSGSILFVDSNISLAENNSNLFWDDTATSLGIRTSSPGAPLDVRRNTNGASLNVGIALQNGTAAAAGAQQYSPALMLTGYGWKTDTTAASQEVDFAFIVQPVQGAANPSGTLSIQSRINAGSWTERGSLDTTGKLSVTEVAVTGIAQTSGAVVLATITGAAHTDQTASTEINDVYINLGQTKTWAAGAIATQRAVRIAAPTYNFASASTITDAATFYIDAAPAAGGAATISSAWAIWIDAGQSRFDAAIQMAQGSYYTFQGDTTTGLQRRSAGVAGLIAAGNGELFVDNVGTATANGRFSTPAGASTNTAYQFVNDVDSGMYSSAADNVGLVAGGNVVFASSTTSASMTWAVATSGSPVHLTVNGAAHTTLTASTEAPDIKFALNRTVQFAAGALATQRAFQILAPTYGFDSASTLSDAATLYIDRAPQVGSGATITRAYSLWIDAGVPRIDSVTANDTTACVFTANVGPVGANTAIQEWLTININGTARFIPCW